MIDFVKVGERIADSRRRIGLSQDELADRLYVTRQAVSKWERGASAPSIDTLASMSRLFSLSFEEILGLNEGEASLNLNEDNIFENHDRGYIISKLISGELKINIPDKLYQMSPAERMLILRKIKDGSLKVDKDELYPKLTPHEQKYINSND